MRKSKELLLSTHGENLNSLNILEDIFQKIKELEKRLIISFKDEFLWIAMSQLIINYYTVCETILFRYAQAFENYLEPDKWHKSLLNKMRVEITDIRPAVISDSVYKNLDSLRRFRHFIRYYHQLSLDIEEIKLILKRIDQVHDEFKECNNKFLYYTKNLADELDNE